MPSKIQTRTIGGSQVHRVIEYDEKDGRITARGDWQSAVPDLSTPTTPVGVVGGGFIGDVPGIADTPLAEAEGTAADPEGAGLGQVPPDAEPNPSNG